MSQCLHKWRSFTSHEVRTKNKKLELVTKNWPDGRSIKFRRTAFQGFSSGAMMISRSFSLLVISRCIQVILYARETSHGRSFQGIGSSFGTVSGLGMIGAYYDDDISRIEVMGRAMSGLALGVLGKPRSLKMTSDRQQLTMIKWARRLAAFWRSWSILTSRLLYLQARFDLFCCKFNFCSKSSKPI